jgi:curved DNA-binding protein
MDHYQTLGVAKNATPDEIKKAYRKLASQHHPDKGGDTAMFQKVEEAYRILSDPQKRQEYDNPRPQFNGFSGEPGFSFNGFNLDELFGHAFRQQSQNFGQRNQVFRTQIIISLEDAYRGTEQILKIQTPTGPKVINIDIPKGIIDGSSMRYDNVLDNATLLVEFRVRPHLKYERRGNDLYCNQSISVLDLIVGSSFEFETISGKVLEVGVTPKTQPYMQLKISGQGMPISGTSRYGDQIILIKPFIPDNIDDEITQSILRSKKK